MPNTVSIVNIGNSTDIAPMENDVAMRVFRVHSEYYFLMAEMTLREDKEAGE